MFDQEDLKKLTSHWWSLGKHVIVVLLQQLPSTYFVNLEKTICFVQFYALHKFK